MTLACHYSIVRFLPFVETGEFANVGVVLLCPGARVFGFKLMKARHARVTNFFDKLDGKVFRSVMRQAQEELQRLAEELKPFGTDRRLRTFDRAATFALWNELTKPLASVLQMSEPRITMAADPQVKLRELFSYYVERNFVTKEYHEGILERSVRGVLRRFGVSERFQYMRLGDDTYNAGFPLVAVTEDEKPLQVIKPLNLAYDEPTRIIDHGAAWVHRIGTLRQRGFLPDDVLVAFDGGTEEDTRQGEARRQALESFASLDISICHIDESAKVESFLARLVTDLTITTQRRDVAAYGSILGKATNRVEELPLLLELSGKGSPQ